MGFERTPEFEGKARDILAKSVRLSPTTRARELKDWLEKFPERVHGEDQENDC